MEAPNSLRLSKKEKTQITSKTESIYFIITFV